MSPLRNLIKSIPGVVKLYYVLQNDKPQITRRIKQTFRSQSKIFFVQIGSNDGLHGDPLRPLIFPDRRYSGLFIEPVEYVYDKLRLNYNDDTSRFLFLNQAIANKHEYRKFYYVSDKAIKSIPDLPEWWNQLGTFDCNHIAKHLGGRLEQFIVAKTVKCSPVSDVLSEHGIEKVDLIHVDTEGYDFEVLKTIDFRRYRPKVVLFEKKHLSHRDQGNARDMLVSLHYKIYGYRDDVLAIRGD